MKRYVAPLILALGMEFALVAGAVTVGYNPRTGDIWLDTELNEINRYGRSYGDYFIDEIVVVYGAPRTLVRELYYERRWEPADIYYACALAALLGRPCLEVVEIYERDRGQGWGAIAQSLGIKPGSDAFHRLKGRIGASGGKFKRYDEGYKGKSTASSKTTGSGNSAAKSTTDPSANADKTAKGNSGDTISKDKETHENQGAHSQGVKGQGKSQGKNNDKNK